MNHEGMLVSLSPMMLKYTVKTVHLDYCPEEAAESQWFHQVEAWYIMSLNWYNHH